MNTLQPNILENQEFRTTANPKSELILYLLNTLCKSRGEGEYPSLNLLPSPHQTATVGHRT
jgi:hypothetical protein